VDKLSDPGAMIAVASVTDEARRKAAAYLTRKGYADLLPMLGIAPKATPTGWLATACPTCSARAGSKCRKDAGGMMARPHAARSRIAP